MRAFLFYIDDWLSSKSIDQMDAHEERGYLRLLLRAATEPDCGLPADDAALAIFSKLGQQWYKPTRDKGFRFGGKTSGQKLRECFFENNGRLYNERLLKEFNHQTVVRAKRAISGASGGSNKSGRSANGKQMLSNGIANGVANDEQKQTNDVYVCSSSSSEEKQNTKTQTEKTIHSDSSPDVHLGPRYPPLSDPDFDYTTKFHELWELYPRKGRTKLLDSQRMYVETVSVDPHRVHEQLIAPLRPGGKWDASDLWKRGYIFGLFEYLRNRRYVEDPEPWNAKSGTSAPTPEPKKLLITELYRD